MGAWFHLNWNAGSMGLTRQTALDLKTEFFLQMPLENPQKNLSWNESFWGTSLIFFLLKHFCSFDALYDTICNLPKVKVYYLGVSELITFSAKGKSEELSNHFPL